MARAYTLHDIDGVTHELRPVKVGDKKIGFVPVRCVESIQDVEDWIADAGSSFDEELIITCLKSGVAVHLQRLARESVSGDKFTTAAYNKMFNKLSKDELLALAGDAAGLNRRLKEMWDSEQTDIEDVDETTIHEDIR